jgi:hypothetical protein
MTITLRRLATLICTLAVAFTAIAVTPTVAHAATNGQWALLPYVPANSSGAARSNFALEVKPGQTLTDKVSLFNLTNKPISFKLFSADAYNTPKGGGFALQTDTQKPVDAGSWIHIYTTSYTIAPLTRADIPVTITVPNSATPGDHAAGIVALNINPATIKKSGSVTYAIKDAVGVRVYVRVLGPLKPSLEVSNVGLQTDAPALTPLVGTGSAKITYTIVNAGNTRLTPKAHVTIDDIFGRTVKTIDDKKLPELLPGGKITVTEPWSSLPLLGVHYSATVNVTAPDVHASGSASAWVIPWVLLLLIALIGGGFYYWRRRQYEKTEAPGRPPRDREMAKV